MIRPFILKITVSILALSVLFPATVCSKDKKKEPLPFRYEVRAGWGGYPMWDALMLGFGSVSEMVFIPYSPLASIYDDYSGDTFMTGTFSAEFSFHFRKWFSLALGLNADGIYSKRYSADTGMKTGTDRGIVLTFMPHLRFSYLNREYVKLYSSFGAGISYATFRDTYLSALCLQLVPVGVTVGKKVFGFFEVGAGSLYVGCMAGVGFRF